MSHYLLEISFAFSNEFATLFDIGAYLRKNKLWVYFAITFYERVTQRCWY